MPSWMFKKESNRGKTKNRDSKKKPAQLQKNDNRATQDVKVQEGTTEGKFVVSARVHGSSVGYLSDKRFTLKTNHKPLKLDIQKSIFF